MEIRSLVKEHKARALWAEDERLQAVELLRFDPLYERIPKNDIFAIVDDALAVGYAQSDFLTGRIATRDPLVAARELDIKIMYDISQGSAGMRILSRYEPKPPSIVLYDAAIRTCRDRLARAGAAETRAAAVLLTNMCVAHEIYHHVERKTASFVNLGYRITVLDIGFVKIEKSLSGLSEIAAHAFVKRMLGLPFLPCVLHPVFFSNA